MGAAADPKLELLDAQRMPPAGRGVGLHAGMGSAQQVSTPRPSQNRLALGGLAEGLVRTLPGELSDSGCSSPGGSPVRRSSGSGLPGYAAAQLAMCAGRLSGSFPAGAAVLLPGRLRSHAHAPAGKQAVPGGGVGPTADASCSITLQPQRGSEEAGSTAAAKGHRDGAPHADLSSSRQQAVEISQQTGVHGTGLSLEQAAAELEALCAQPLSEKGPPLGPQGGHRQSDKPAKALPGAALAATSGAGSPGSRPPLPDLAFMDAELGLAELLAEADSILARASAAAGGCMEEALQQTCDAQHAGAGGTAGQQGGAGTASGSSTACSMEPWRGSALQAGSSMATAGAPHLAVERDPSVRCCA
jgi:hypothetical protein